MRTFFCGVWYCLRAHQHEQCKIRLLSLIIFALRLLSICANFLFSLCLRHCHSHSRLPPLVWQCKGRSRSNASPLLTILFIEPPSLDVMSKLTKPVSFFVHQQMNGHQSISSLMLLLALPLDAFYSSSYHKLSPPIPSNSFHTVLPGINAN